MWRSKKFIIGIVLAAMLLLGSLGGAVLADDSQPGVGFMERLAEKLGISTEELKDKMTEAKGEMPDRGFGKWQGKRGTAGTFSSCLEELAIDVDMDALKAALAEAREEIKGQDDVDHRSIMAGVLESFGIDIAELEAARGEICPEGRPDGGRMDPEAMQNQLQTLLDEGEITQEQYDKKKTWMESMPDKMPGFGFKKGTAGFHMGGMHGAGILGSDTELTLR